MEVQSEPLDQICGRKNHMMGKFILKELILFWRIA